MKGFKLNSDEIWTMLHIFQEELEEHFGEFDGDIYIEDNNIIIKLDDEKYVEPEAVVRSIEKFLEKSQFNADEFTIDAEMKYSIYITYKLEN